MAAERWSPLPEKHTTEILEKLHAMASSVIRGSLLVSVLYGVLVGLGFFIFGLPSAILWGAVTVVAAFIPVFGVFLVVVPGIISLAIGGHVLAAIGLTVWILIIALFVASVAYRAEGKDPSDADAFCRAWRLVVLWSNRAFAWPARPQSSAYPACDLPSIRF